jgi:ADP-ribose pyrophosphatase
MTESAAPVFSTPWFSIRDISQPGSDEPYYSFDMPPGVVIWPVTSDGHFVLVRQYRPTLNKVTLEFPAGAVDADETPEQAARRELREETGYVSADLICAGTGSIRIERESTKNYFYFAPNAEKIAGFTAVETIETVLVTSQEFRMLVTKGDFDHIAALTIAPMLLCRWGVNVLESSK